MKGTISLRLRQRLHLKAGNHRKSSSRICGDFLRHVCTHNRIDSKRLGDGRIVQTLMYQTHAYVYTDKFGLSPEDDELLGTMLVSSSTG